MLLAIETSCDETGVALFSEEGKLVEHLVYSQVALHSPFGGIVPEIASRKQLEVLPPLIKTLLKKKDIDIKDIKAIAVTFGPGLIGSLLVGVSLAKALSFSLKAPLIAVDHLHAHFMAIFLEQEVDIPFIALVVSGGHTVLFKVESYFDFFLIGHTRDDAAGEAFDKVAKLLNLGYPGGPIISKLAQKGDPEAIPLPSPLIDEPTFDFSFSGLKTAVANFVKHHEFKLEDLCASFEKAVCKVLVEKTLRACKKLNIPRAVVAGGVAANQRLRETFIKTFKDEGLNVFFPSLEFCTDNAAMVGLVGFLKWKKGMFATLETETYARGHYKKLHV